MGISASKRVGRYLHKSAEFNSACDSVYDDCLSLAQHAFDGVKPYQLVSATERLHSKLSDSIPLVAKWVQSAPTRAQVDKAFKAVRSDSEAVLGNSEFREFAVEVFADAVASGAGQAVWTRVPVGVAGIAGIGMLVKPGREFIAAAIGAYTLGVTTSIYLSLDA
ncbi:PREDICTED: uncharacterized protein LOC109179611 [Ipomoea nil]|uniref:uncharacterized protein LOC109179611 n=1 Tax=Ipomoea nil TaxID=35883 RepID=UPI000900A180|nr:PREDICTED: uncharacterized protein LOC109179611 [Ipomoea nil]